MSAPLPSVSSPKPLYIDSHFANLRPFLSCASSPSSPFSFLLTPPNYYIFHVNQCQILFKEKKKNTIYAHEKCPMISLLKKNQQYNRVKSISFNKYLNIQIYSLSKCKMKNFPKICPPSFTIQRSMFIRPIS